MMLLQNRIDMIHLKPVAPALMKIMLTEQQRAPREQQPVDNQLTLVLQAQKIADHKVTY
jgi:hypothetical protein